MAKKKELVEVTIKLFPHQIEFFKYGAKQIGKNIKRRGFAKKAGKPVKTLQII